MSSIFLTSTGLSNEAVRNAFLQEAGERRDQHIAIVTNAARDGKENTYVRLAEKQFRDSGFSAIFFIDVEIDPLSLIQDAEIMYVAGGNTFTLLKKIRSSGADKILFERLTTDNHLLYMGVSAGSIILTPTIRIANEVAPDPNEEGLTDFSGLSIFSEEICPHYTEKIETELREYEMRHSVHVRRMSNEEALLLKNGETTLIA